MQASTGICLILTRHIHLYASFNSILELQLTFVSQLPETLLAIPFPARSSHSTRKFRSFPTHPICIRSSCPAASTTEFQIILLSACYREDTPTEFGNERVHSVGMTNR